MRQRVTATRLNEFMKALGLEVSTPGRIFLAGGATAVLNIELASPDDFIPALPGWQERSRFIQQEGRLAFLHYDFYGQALAKIERGHDIDLRDVQEMIRRGLIVPKRLLELFADIEDQIYKYPAIDKPSFRQKVERLVEEANRREG